MEGGAMEGNGSAAEGDGIPMEGHGSAAEAIMMKVVTVKKSRTETRTLSERRRRKTGMGMDSSRMTGNSAHTQRNSPGNNKYRLAPEPAWLPISCRPE